MHDSDADSTLGDDVASDTESLRSSILDYEYENGRRYHAYHSGSYWGPNDEKANWHSDLGHHIYKLLLRGHLFFAPIPKDVHRVIDIGTGTGIWAIEFADDYPSATVIGTDLSPIQPPLVPPNLSFEIDDCCDEWLHTPDTFDFVHVRGLYGCVADWDEFYHQALKHIRPGGYIEQVERGVCPKSDDHSTDGTIMERWGHVSLEAGDAFGKTLRVINETKPKILKAGFEDVVEHRFKCPIGDWPEDPRLKELGKVNRVYWEEGIEDWTTMLLTRVLKWTPEQVKVYQDQARKGLRNPSIHSYDEM
ncbi:hypothetical protein LOZ53_000191 [Ophidiomyces ophidiicola]|nr:hypothetical protein LOZ54_001984 [Ophidiomyces ophidiicola]KAI1994525.1 hypothetical protein LOZ51_003718 [Ophidiomyces ophidiicola]KAI1997785.1 hypothetical protein LOZ53_000191 [Ophidiomyces ophidiicola]